jgi:hypothetical protein
MAAGPGEQFRTLSRLMSRPAQERRAIRRYYREAQRLIPRFHAGKHSPDRLERAAQRLDGSAAADGNPRRQRRLLANAQALRAYLELYGDRVFDVLPASTLTLVFEPLELSLRPDLVVVENGRLKLMKLHLATSWSPSAEVGDVVSRGMYEAARKAGIDVLARNVLYIDVAKRQEFRGRAMSQRMRGDIKAACFQIAACVEMLAAMRATQSADKKAKEK